jgi:hypothetical protein
VPLAEQR